MATPLPPAPTPHSFHSSKCVELPLTSVEGGQFFWCLWGRNNRKKYRQLATVKLKGYFLAYI